MVKIINYHLRESKDGDQFIALELQGDLEFVQSSETGRFYATAKRCSVTSTFDEDKAKTLLGRELPGRIVRTQCDEYDYTIPDSGEIIKLSHTYEYLPEDAPMERVKLVREVVTE